MKSILLMMLVLPISAFGAESSLLQLRREKPFLNCDISSNTVKIVRKTQGVQFSKIVKYEIDDMSSLIEDAYNSHLPEVTGIEHYAFNKSNLKFPLSGNDPKSLKLIRLISELCELRNL